jgi:hypothetical protein
MTDPRVAKLMASLRRRFPGKTLVTGPMPDEPGSGEVAIQVLDIPADRHRVVEAFASKTILDLWGDDPWPAFVFAVSPEASVELRARVRAASRRPRRRPAKSRA